MKNSSAATIMWLTMLMVIYVLILAVWDATAGNHSKAWHQQQTYVEELKVTYMTYEDQMDELKKEKADLDNRLANSSGKEQAEYERSLKANRELFVEIWDEYNTTKNRYREAVDRLKGMQ